MIASQGSKWESGILLEPIPMGGSRFSSFVSSVLWDYSKFLFDLQQHFAYLLIPHKSRCWKLAHLKFLSLQNFDHASSGFLDHSLMSSEMQFLKKYILFAFIRYFCVSVLHAAPWRPNAEINCFHSLLFIIHSTHSSKNVFYKFLISTWCFPIKLLQWLLITFRI